MSIKTNRDRHGFRGVPPPATFSLEALPADTLLTVAEVAAILRKAKSTVTEDDSLEWINLPGGSKRATVQSVRAHIAAGAPRRRKVSAAALSLSEV